MELICRFIFNVLVKQGKGQSCNPSTDLNPSYTSVSGLINYWAFCDSYNDVIGTAHGYGQVNAALTSDRFGLASSALDLSNGYIKIPSGIYFNGDYTVTAWVYMRSFPSYSPLIDFGNGAPSDNVWLGLSEDTTGKLSQELFVGP